MPDIYDQHQAAFAHVSAFVIIDKNGDKVATVALKHPRDGAGRLYAYVHIFGTTMVRGFASGGGYDKISAAIAAAVAKIKLTKLPEHWTEIERAQYDALRSALAHDGSARWDSHAREAGFTVHQAV